MCASGAVTTTIATTTSSTSQTQPKKKFQQIENHSNITPLAKRNRTVIVVSCTVAFFLLLSCISSGRATTRFYRTNVMQIHFENARVSVRTSFDKMNMMGNLLLCVSVCLLHVQDLAKIELIQTHWECQLYAWIRWKCLHKTHKHFSIFFFNRSASDIIGVNAVLFTLRTLYRCKRNGMFCMKQKQQQRDHIFYRN